MFDKQASSSSNASLISLLIVVLVYSLYRQVCYNSVFHVCYFCVSMYLGLELVRFGDLYIDKVYLFSI